jgi:hypothetical protein
MNERIRELAEQAGATLEKGYIELSDGQLMLSDNVDLDKSNLDLEKFAELIVEECVGIADEYDGVGSTIVSRIKEHFGVEL